MSSPSFQQLSHVVAWEPSHHCARSETHQKRLVLPLPVLCVRPLPQWIKYFPWWRLEMTHQPCCSWRTYAACYRQLLSLAFIYPFLVSVINSTDSKAYLFSYQDRSEAIIGLYVSSSCICVISFTTAASAFSPKISISYLRPYCWIMLTPIMCASVWASVIWGGSVVVKLKVYNPLFSTLSGACKVVLYAFHFTLNPDNFNLG